MLLNKILFFPVVNMSCGEWFSSVLVHMFLSMVYNFNWHLKNIKSIVYSVVFPLRFPVFCNSTSLSLLHRTPSPAHVCCFISCGTIFWVLTLSPWESLFWPQGLSTVSHTLSGLGIDLHLKKPVTGVLWWVIYTGLLWPVHFIPHYEEFSGEK